MDWNGMQSDRIYWNLGMKITKKLLRIGCQIASSRSHASLFVSSMNFFVV